VEEGKVIPVIGPELVTVEEDGASLPLYDWLARSLAERIDLGTPDKRFASLGQTQQRTMG